MYQEVTSDCLLGLICYFTNLDRCFLKKSIKVS